MKDHNPKEPALYSYQETPRDLVLRAMEVIEEKSLASWRITSKPYHSLSVSYLEDGRLVQFDSNLGRGGKKVNLQLMIYTPVKKEDQEAAGTMEEIICLLEPWLRWEGKVNKEVNLKQSYTS